MDGTWMSVIAPWIDSASLALSTIDTTTWVLAAGILVVLAVALSARGSHRTAEDSTRHLSGEYRQQSSAIDGLRGELNHLAEEMRGLKLTHDDGKLSFITDLLEKLTDQERERRRHVTALDDNVRQLMQEVRELRERPAAGPGAGGAESTARLGAVEERLDALSDELAAVRARLAEAPAMASGQETGSAVAGLAVDEERLASMSADLAALKGRFDRLDDLMQRLSELRVE